jgi:AraC-like DNA-binding protein
MSRQLIDLILHYTDAQAGHGPYVTPIADVLILRSDQEKPPTHRLFAPAICIVAQGAKCAVFGDRSFEYRAGEALIVSVTAPSLGRVIQASSAKPCLVMAIALDLALMRDVAEGLHVLDSMSADCERGILVTDFTGPLSDCAVRIMRLFDTPQAIDTIYPLIMREMCFWLMAGPNGQRIAELLVGSPSGKRVREALEWLRHCFSQTVRLQQLAAIAQMSTSAFHRQFKALTSMTPLQYQKKLRLIEARRLMTSEGINAESAAFRVGYASQSQFSREYGRTFGEPPRRHIRIFSSGEFANLAVDDGPEPIQPRNRDTSNMKH